MHANVLMIEIHIMHSINYFHTFCRLLLLMSTVWTSCVLRKAIVSVEQHFINSKSFYQLQSSHKCQAWETT